MVAKFGIFINIDVAVRMFANLETTPPVDGSEVLSFALQDP